MVAEFHVAVQEWMDSYRHFTEHFSEVEQKEINTEQY